MPFFEILYHHRKLLAFGCRCYYQVTQNTICAQNSSGVHKLSFIYLWLCVQAVQVAAHAYGR